MGGFTNALMIFIAVSTATSLVIFIIQNWNRRYRVDIIEELRKEMVFKKES